MESYEIDNLLDNVHSMCSSKLTDNTPCIFAIAPRGTDTVKGLVLGNWTDYTKFSMVMSVIRSFDLNPRAIALALLMQYNPLMES